MRSMLNYQPRLTVNSLWFDRRYFVLALLMMAHFRSHSFSLSIHQCAMLISGVGYAFNIKNWREKSIAMAMRMCMFLYTVYLSVNINI